MSDVTSFTIQPILPSEAEEIYQFAYDNFIKDEPLNKSCGLETTPEMKSYIISPLAENCSFKAVNKEGETIGVIISEIKTRPAADVIPVKKEKPNADCTNVEKPLKFVEYIDSQWNIFEHYPQAKRILYGILVAVNGNYRGKGVAGELVGRTRQWMLDNDIPAMKRICSSEFSARVMKRLKMCEVHSVNYKDFLVDGQVFVQPAVPHVACRSFVMEVQK